MKNLLKSLVVAVVGWQVRRLQKHSHFTTIGVIGSYGKTSTKMAVAEVLETEFHVQYQKGNYNDIVSVPLVFFGQNLPSLFNPFSWLKVFWENEKVLRQEVFPFDVVVLELGIDGPDQMIQFKKYLRLDYLLVTSLGPEHMERFKSLKEVAKEELSAQNFSKQVIVNKDLCSDELLQSLRKPYEVYKLEYPKRLPLDNWQIVLDGGESMRVQQTVLSKARMYTLSAAAVIGMKMGIDKNKVLQSLDKATAVPGRMNALKGKKNSTIIDDTYNASPEATILALETLYSYPAKQRIALLGNMNELGKFSEKLHRRVGEACQPGKLDLVVTLGEHANEYLADQAEKAGCKVKRTNSPYEAAEIIEESLKADSVILAKGSQNGVFAEEAVKMLLESPADSKYLVRQSDQWLEKKKKSFSLL